MRYKTEKIAILVASYNGEKYLGELLDSLLAQSETGWVAYIHDDGSTDGTAVVIAEYANRYPEKFVCVEGEPSGGAKNNFFFLFRQVEAPLYMCCDQDDVWLPDKMEKTLRRMRGSRGAESCDPMTGAEREALCDNVGRTAEIPRLVFSDLRVADRELHPIADSMNQYQRLHCEDLAACHLMIENVVVGCTMMVNRALRDRLIEVTDLTDVVMHDWWAALIAAQFGGIAYLDEATILYRQHGDNEQGARKFGPSYIMYKLTHSKQAIRGAVEEKQRQARLFAEIYDLPDDSAIRLFGDALDAGKLRRIRLYRQSGVRKSTFSRNMGLYIFG
ncbi:MAG: glycosyltransferase family 2 protein [Clostridiales bacterium]|nr:glycosyltransferase family 2 protein [Clostridiales bacterium]